MTVANSKWFMVRVNYQKLFDSINFEHSDGRVDETQAQLEASPVPEAKPAHESAALDLE